MTFAFRYYQEEAIDAVFDYWRTGGGNPLIEAATGVGKSAIMGGLMHRLINSYPDMRIIQTAHVQELVQQNALALQRMWSSAPIGINSASLGRRDTRAQILFASVQSVANNADKLGPRDVMVIDECHLTPRSGEGRYLTLIKGLRKVRPDLRIVGLSATPFRMDSGLLVGGDNSIFNKIVYKYGIAQGVKDGYLSPLVSKATKSRIDVSKVGKTGGDFNAAALEAASDVDWLNKSIVDEIVAFGRSQNRKGWIVFASGVSHAEHLTAVLRESGVIAEYITGATHKDRRQRILRAFKERHIECLVSMNVLTTGFDAPHVDLIAMCRATLSKSLYIQMAGRGTRLAEGKTDCLVLDFAENVRRHGPVDKIEVGPRDSGKVKEDEIAAKRCKHCETLNPVAALICENCGELFPVEERAPGGGAGFRKPKYNASADAESVIMGTAPPQWVPVDGWRALVHKKPEAKDSVRVEYQCGMAVHREWVHMDLQMGKARLRGERWWLDNGGQKPFPMSVQEAIERFGELTRPTDILLKPDGKFFTITNRRFHNESEDAA